MNHSTIFVCSQDDFASFANTEGGNYPSRISKTASETRWGFYWTIWMAWQGVNKTAANWSCQQQQQQQQERDDDSSNSSSSYAITRWLQHDVVAATCCQPAAVAACCLPQLGNNCKQTFLMSFICFFLLSFYFLFFLSKLKKENLQREVKADAHFMRHVGNVARAFYVYGQAI